MNGYTPLVVLLYSVAIFSVLGGYLAYILFSSMRWDESEVRSMERLELHLAQILRLLEAPDVNMLLRDRQSRQRLFLEFSENLRGDVVHLLKSRRLDLGIQLFAATFFFSYYFLRIKAYLACGRNDLRFLSGLELALLRRLEGI